MKKRNLILTTVSILLYGFAVYLFTWIDKPEATLRRNDANDRYSGRQQGSPSDGLRRQGDRSVGPRHDHPGRIDSGGQPVVAERDRVPSPAARAAPPFRGESPAPLPEAEQKSLWKAFAEARREVQSIPEAWGRRPENIGYVFYALHSRQQLYSRYGEQGVQLVSTRRTYTGEDTGNPDTSWEARIRLWSFSGKEVTAPVAPEKSPHQGNRVEYRHGGGVTEWFVNGNDGLEHGYTIAARPDRVGDDRGGEVEVALEGLQAAEREDGLAFLDGHREVLRYGKLKVLDARGQELSAWMKATDKGFLIAWNDRDAAYPVTVDPLITSAETKLTVDNSTAGESFGIGVSLSGDSALIGSHWDDDGGAGSGSAYVFVRSGDSWSQQAKLTASDGAAGDHFGSSVSLSGGSALIGAYAADDGGSSSGSAYVFVRSGTSWSQQAKLTASDAAEEDRFGWAVSLSGNSALIGAHWDDDGGSRSGSVYVFERNSTSWGEQAKLTASDAAAGDYFGSSVSLSGDSALIGAYYDTHAVAGDGSAYVFVRSGGSWSEQAKLTASDAAAGDSFGFSVSLFGDNALVGAFGDDDAGSGSGSAYVFVRSGTSWSQHDKLTALDAAAGDKFGSSVSLSGDSALIGAHRDDHGGGSSGSVYAFVRSGTSWSQQAKLIASDAAFGDEFGSSVSIDGERALIGAFRDDDGGSGSGSAYAFVRSGSSWSQQAKLTASDPLAGDEFGISVSLSGDTALIGAYEDDDRGINSGSAYVFVRDGSSWSRQAKLTASDAGQSDYFGRVVSLSGDSALIGAHRDDDGGLNSGSAYVYVRDGTNWSQQAKLTAPDAAESDFFGWAVSLSGDSALIGAYLDDDAGASSGSAYVFVRSGNIWTAQAKLTASDAAAGGEFGRSVSLSGDDAIIGAFTDEAGTSSGSAYVFVRSGTSWSQQAKLTASDAAQTDAFGVSVSLSGDTALIGAYNDSHAVANGGSAYVFVRSGNIWGGEVKLTASDAAQFDNFGRSVSLSGDTALIGAYRDDDGAADSGSAYVFVHRGGIWTEEAKLTAADRALHDWFGYSVSVSGDTALVGARWDDDGGDASGSAHVFRLRNSGERALLVADHLANELLNGGHAAPFGGQDVGGSGSYTFQLVNKGTLDLDLQSVSLAGTHAGQFALGVPDISSAADLAGGESLDLAVTFNPTHGRSGQRNATVIIVSNDSSAPVFSFNVTGLALSPVMDADGDGMNDWGEYSLRGFGFDWEKQQKHQVSDYYNLSPAAGLYTTKQVQAMNVDVPLLGEDPVTGDFLLTIGVQKSTDLQDYFPFPMSDPQTSINGEGKLEFRFTDPGAPAFFRLESN